MAIKFLDESVSATPNKIVFTDESPQVSSGKITFTEPAPEVDLTKPAFLTPSAVGKDAAAKKVQAEAEAERNKPKITYDELYGNPEIFKIINDYSKVAMGSTYKEGADKKEFVNNFMANMRGEEWNTFSNVAALNKLKNSSLPDREKLALGNRLFQEVASAGSEGGQPGAAPYLDIAKSALTDLTNYIGFGVGTALKKTAAKEATKVATKAAIGEAGEAAVKSRIAGLLTPAGITGVTTATEAGIGVGQNVVEQKKKQEVAKAMREEPKELDPVQMGVAALFGGVGGFIEGRAALATTGGKSGAEQFSEKLLKAKLVKDPNAPVTEFERMIADPVAQNMDDVVSQFNKQEGRRIVDEIDPATALTDAKIQSDLSARAVRVAMHVIDADPTFRLKPNQKTSDAISEVFSNLDTIDDAILEQAIRREGLSPEQFAQANLMTVSDAARVMQQYSAASRILNRMTQIDPEVGKLVDGLFNKPDEYVSALGRVGQAVRTVERESKAFIVSGIGTTVRNVLGTTVGLVYNSAASLLEGAMYTIGRTLDGAASGNRIETAKNSLGDTFRDAFSVYGYMSKNGLSNEVTDKLLEHNPALRNNILSATQESSTTELSKAARVFNTLNVAQDAFFRKAIFNAAVEKHMRRAGMDMYQVIGEGKTIPASILQQASDETLKATFSYTPKVQKKGIETFESGAEAAGNLFIKAAEFPGGSLVATFPRFMSNAIAFQYRYSVFGAVSGAEDLLNGAVLKASGSSAGDGLIRKGQENIAKGVVGTAALAAAYDYRLNNQDTDWYNMKKDDGGTVDTRSIFPLGPTLAVGDFLAKRKLGLEPKTAEMVEAIVGMKMPAGTQNQLLDQVFAAMSSEKDADKLEIAIGKVLGDFTARFSQPFVFKSAYEFFDLFREGGAIQRDPNVIEAESTAGRIFEAGAQRVQSKLPVIKESLPEAIPRLREGPVYKEGEFFYSLIGVRETPAKTPVESEIVRLGIDPYKLYGPSSGDKQYDRLFVQNANPLVIQAVTRAMSNDRYKALSPTEQKVSLGNVVRDVTDIARDMTDSKFLSGDLLRVKKMQFNKLSGDERKIINERYAKEHSGKTLEEANDYLQVDKYKAMMGNLQFAVGGMVASKLAAKAAKALPTESFLSKARALATPEPTVDASTIDNIINKNLPPAPAVAEQTMQAIPTAKKVVAPKPVVEEIPAAAVPEAPVARQMDEAMPTPIEAVPEAPTPMPTVVDEAIPATSAFTPEQYAAGEKLMAENYTPEFVKNWKIANYDDYMSTAHSYAGQAAGLKWNQTPPNPFMKQADDSAASIVDDIPYGEDKYLLSEPESFVKPRLSEEKIDQVYVGDLNKQVSKTSTNQRNAIIAEIKNKREDSFFKLRDNMDFANVDDEVLGVMLGEYRAKYKTELSPKNPDQLVRAKDMATQLQTKLEQMREQYKDVPPVRLYHGGRDEGIEKLKKSGFFDPAQYTNEHAEMRVGAPSFTKDLNLGFSASSFGGRNAENYLYTEIPYADYKFSRINMRPEGYDAKDMNTIVRAITGAPDVVRPISLPRAGFNETEDMMVEANKLRVKGGNVKLKPVGAEDERFGRAITGIKTRTEMIEGRDLVATLMADAAKTSNKKESTQLAYKSYTALRDLMNDYMSMSKGAIGAGTGQQYQSTIDQMVDYGGIVKQMPEVASILSSIGAKQKAKNLMQLRDVLRDFSATEPGFAGSSAKLEAKRKDALQKVREITPKLAKGGLASRR
jgi:hypothetical protein